MLAGFHLGTYIEPAKKRVASVMEAYDGFISEHPVSGLGQSFGALLHVAGDPATYELPPPSEPRIQIYGSRKFVPLSSLEQVFSRPYSAPSAVSYEGMSLDGSKENHEVLRASNRKRIDWIRRHALTTLRDTMAHLANEGFSHDARFAIYTLLEEARKGVLRRVECPEDQGEKQEECSGLETRVEVFEAQERVREILARDPPRFGWLPPSFDYDAFEETQTKTDPVPPSPKRKPKPQLTQAELEEIFSLW